MAINNLEQAAMTAASTGVTPTRVPQYEDRPGDEWMSYVPEAYGQLPDAIRRQRQREVSELESGIPEAIRQAAQPMARRGLYGSGLQLEDIGQAALQRQIAIDKAKTLAEIDPLKAQIAMGDLAQQRGTQRAQESRRRYEKEEAYSQQQKARDDLMRQAMGASALKLASSGPLGKYLGLAEDSVLEKYIKAKYGIGGAASRTLMGDLKNLLGLGGSPVTADAMTLEELGGGTPLIYNKAMSDAAVKAEQARQQEYFNKTSGTGTGTPQKATSGTGTPQKLITGTAGTFLSQLDKMTPEQIEGLGKGFGGPDVEYDPVYDESVVSDIGTDQFNIDQQLDQIRNLDIDDAKLAAEELGAGIGWNYPDNITDTGINIEEGFNEDYFKELTQGFDDPEWLSPYPEIYSDPDIIKAYDSGLDDEGWGGTVPGQSLSPQPGEDVPNVVDWIKGLFSDSSDATTTGVSGDNLFASAGIRDWSQVDDVWRGSAPQINTGDNNFSETISEWFEGNKTIPEDISNLASDAVSAVKDLTGNLVNPSTAISLALSAAQGGIKNVLSNPLSLIGNKVLASQGLLPTSLSTIAKLPGAIGSAIASPSTALGGTLGGAAGAAAVIGAPMALIGAGIASNRKARAQAEIEEKKNRTGSARYNFVPGELWMAGNKRTSPVLDEANTNFRYTDELTGMHIIYEQDPRRPVMGGDSLSKRGEDFAREAGIDYTTPDPDIQNTSQKWLGKQQVYSELIPELKPVFMAGLKGQMPRNQTEDMVAKVTNRYFQENPNISEIYRLNKKIEYLTEQNKSEGDSFVEGQITDLEFQREGLKENVPEGWKKVKAFKPMPVIISIEEEEQE